MLVLIEHIISQDNGRVNISPDVLTFEQTLHIHIHVHNRLGFYKRIRCKTTKFWINKFLISLF